MPVERIGPDLGQLGVRLRLCGKHAIDRGFSLSLPSAPHPDRINPGLSKPTRQPRSFVGLSCRAGKLSTCLCLPALTCPVNKSPPLSQFSVLMQRSAKHPVIAVLTASDTRARQPSDANGLITRSPWRNTSTLPARHSGRHWLHSQIK